MGFHIAPNISSRLHICNLPKTPITAYEKMIALRKVLKVTLDRTFPFLVKESCANCVNLIRSLSLKRTRSDRALRYRVTDAVI